MTALTCFILTVFLLTVYLSNGQSSAPNVPSDQPIPSNPYRDFIRNKCLQKIALLNAKNGATTNYAENKFCTFTAQEFGKSRCGHKGKKHTLATQITASTGNSSVKSNIASRIASPTDSTTGPAPTVMNYNWTSTLVTSVKNQGACGSCWAFAGIAEVESYFLRRHNLYLDLSEQQMIDCVPVMDTSSSGCGGGSPIDVQTYAVRYLITTEKLYSYTATSNSCNSDKNSTGSYKIKYYFQNFDCNSLANALMSHPVVICGDIDQQWQVYSSGVIPNCNQTIIGGHCVLAVGVVSDGTGIVNNNYWIIKNSWGTSWGEYGYARLYRNPSDNLGICSFCQATSYSM